MKDKLDKLIGEHVVLVDKTIDEVVFGGILIAGNEEGIYEVKSTDNSAWFAIEFVTDITDNYITIVCD